MVGPARRLALTPLPRARMACGTLDFGKVAGSTANDAGVRARPESLQDSGGDEHADARATAQIAEAT